MGNTPVLTVKNITKQFRIPAANELRAKQFTAVRDVSFQVMKGETFGIVGESGCGKSTVAKVLMGIEKPTAGEVWLSDTRIDNMPERKLRLIRPRFQMVFQDSGSSLNGRKRVGDILREPMAYHKIASGKALDMRVDELLEQVGLSAAMRDRYPHEFSGGQRQRICIARALSLNPELVVLDEPVSALDVSVQAQILNLLRDLQQQLGLTYIFIGHGLGAVHYISSRIGVMYMGSLVEYGSAEDVFSHPQHPYTRALLDAAPTAEPNQKGRNRMVLRGEMNWDQTGQTGCSLYSRCPYATPDCTAMTPMMQDVGGGHCAVCLRATDGPVAQAERSE
ncbi:MAG: ATP-binding cassette domain-containing protein [Clostridia bacterium]|nr:ATP-binding cassette domain-containing protein [Clostridia bacterium]